MELQTPRLLLRPWEESDAEALYELAKDPDVGPAAGWNVHKDVEESREIIRTILSAPGTFAIFGRRDGQLRGSCGFFPTRTQGAEAGELEIGYWVGKPLLGPRHRAGGRGGVAGPLLHGAGRGARLVCVFRRKRKIAPLSGEVRLPLSSHGAGRALGGHG